MIVFVGFTAGTIVRARIITLPLIVIPAPELERVKWQKLRKLEYTRARARVHERKRDRWTVRYVPLWRFNVTV